MLVQLTFTTEQVDLATRALRFMEMQEDLPESLAPQVTFLADFLDMVLEDPSGFPVTGRMAVSIKSHNRQMKRAMKQLRKDIARKEARAEDASV